MGALGIPISLVLGCSEQFSESSLHVGKVRDLNSAVLQGTTQPKTKIGDWKKMKYTKLMIPTGLVAIDMVFICSRHNLECAKHPPVTSQAPSRHPTDTPIYATFWPIQGNREKRKKLIKMSLTRCLSIACISYPPRQYPESLRQPPDTSQTPSRHPKIRHMLTNPRQLGYKKPASID